jgi:nucleotidyltransferase/DNA polymerase involved in DNA repair
MDMDAIGHVDADCFYVSAERVRFPHLAGVPVGVLGNHGACVIAKSYEMKAAGVKTGDPILFGPRFALRVDCVFPGWCERAWSEEEGRGD